MTFYRANSRVCVTGSTRSFRSDRIDSTFSHPIYIGCGKGFFANELARQGNRVDGVDVLPDAPEESELRSYYSADLDNGIAPVLDQLRGRQYDRVLLLDVLEHLKDPERILRQSRTAVKPEGVLIVSVPNVANITVRLALLFGRFNYQERGILDRTHLRFFTRRTARAMLKDQQYEILEERTSIMPLELILGLSLENPLLRVMNLALRAATRVFRGLLGYQIMLVARPSSPQAGARP